METDTVVKEAEVEVKDEEQDQTVETEEVKEQAGEETKTDTATVKADEIQGKKDGESVSPEEIMSGQELSDVEKAKAGTPFGVQKRFDELTKQNRKSKARIKELESVKSPVSTDRPLPPKNSDYVDEGEYQQAMVDWKDKDDDWKAARAGVETQGKESEERQNKNVQRYIKDSERMRSRFKDYDEVANNKDVLYREDIVPLILDTDYAPEMDYYLRKNLAELDRIQKLPLLKAATEIGKLEARFDSVRIKKTTNAPAVLNTINSKGDAVAVDINKIKNDDEWFKARQAEKLRKLKEK